VDVEPHPEHQDRQDRQRRRGVGDHRRQRKPEQHRQLRAEHVLAELLHAQNFVLDPCEALHQGDVAERVGGALGDVAVIQLDLALHLFALGDDDGDQRCEDDAQHDQQQAVAPVDQQRHRQQHQQRHQAGEMLAEERQPQPPQRVGAGDHDLHQPAGMRAGVIAQRQLQHVLEKLGAHHLVLTVRQPVGVQRDQRAGDDRKQREADPGTHQQHEALPIQFGEAALRIGQRVDDAAEQHRLDEHRRGHQQVADSQHPAEPRLGPQHLQRADVQPKEFHSDSPGGRIGRLLLRG
jgi:hypothetical protein